MQPVINIAVSGSRAGIGCSTISQAIAEALLAQGFSVNLTIADSLARGPLAQISSLNSLIDRNPTINVYDSTIDPRQPKYQYKNMKLDVFGWTIEEALAKAGEECSARVPTVIPPMIVKVTS